MGLYECRGDINVGDIVGGQREADVRGAFADVNVLIRKYLICLRGDEHAAVKRGFDERADAFAGIIAFLVQGNIDMAFVVDLEGVVVTAPGAPTVEFFADIAVGPWNGYTQFVVAGRPRGKRIPGSIAGDGDEARADEFVLLLGLVAEIIAILGQNGVVLVFDDFDAG